ncbi:unnamed protein product [Arabis nemorensis]|uniref:Terpene synthase metal-binding domain-containing protein n=1 Tax=Arabis nemorensis TaxID=586526 RepID=A0A565BRR9_9BRAS|nr:unnamed protein product [Arabis nemorensis]
MRRPETRWYIDEYEKKHDMNLVLIEFAKIDYNIIQAFHQEDLKYVSGWWKDTCLSNQLPFSRDRIVENFFWTTGLISEPQFGYIRPFETMLFALLTTIDDIYDIYGTLEELELFTVMVENWDVNRLDELPEYMRLCFLVLFNEINGIGCYVLKHKNIDVIPFLKESWADLCQRFLVEAKWYKRGYKPSLEEYMQNAWFSISASTMLIHFYCLYSEQISIQSFQTFSQFQDQQIIRCSCIIIRLANDLGTSPITSKMKWQEETFPCYMHETGASEEKASAHVYQMISDTWEEMNYEAKMAILWKPVEAQSCTGLSPWVVKWFRSKLASVVNLSRL